MEGGRVHYDVAGQGEGLCCEQHSQREIEGPAGNMGKEEKYTIFAL